MMSIFDDGYCGPSRCSTQLLHPPLGVCVAGVGPSRAVAEAAHLGGGQPKVVGVDHVVDAAQSQVRDPNDPAVAVPVVPVVVVGHEPVADGVPDAKLELSETREWHYE